MTTEDGTRTAPDDLLVVSNADAGSNDAEVVDAAVATWRAAGRDVEVVATDDLDDVVEVVADVADRVVVAAGGDGSLHAVLQALHRVERLDDVVVGLLPLGTGNDFARGMGLSLEAQAAADDLLAGEVQDLDLLVDQDGTIGVNAVHVGIGAAASERASALKGGLGPAAYPLGAVAAGATEVGWDLTVTVDGDVLVADRRVLHVVIGNGPSLGGGAAAAPDARPGDHLADVVVALGTGPIARMGYASDLRTGDHVDRDDVLTARGREVEVHGEEHPWNVDGELPPPRSRSTWRLLHGAWHLLAPIGREPDLPA